MERNRLLSSRWCVKVQYSLVLSFNLWDGGQHSTMHTWACSHALIRSLITQNIKDYWMKKSIQPWRTWKEAFWGTKHCTFPAQQYHTIKMRAALQEDWRYEQPTYYEKENTSDGNMLWAASSLSHWERQSNTNWVQTGKREMLDSLGWAPCHVTLTTVILEEEREEWSNNKIVPDREWRGLEEKNVNRIDWKQKTGRDGEKEDIKAWTDTSISVQTHRKVSCD